MSKLVHKSPQSVRVKRLVYESGFICLLLALITYVITSQWPVLQQGLMALKQADKSLIGTTVFISFLAPFVAAQTYYLLALQPIAYLPTLIVQFASGLTNRLLPAGIGGMGINLLYLRARGHTTASAATVIAVNNICGFLASLLLCAATVILRPEILDAVVVRLPRPSPLWTVVVIICLISALWLIRRHVSGARAVVLNSLRVYRTRWKLVMMALLNCVGLVVVMTSLVYLSVLAVGGVCSWSQALLALSLGTLIGNAVPLPGGLGGVEAGMIAALVGFGLPVALAVAAVCLYRLISYFLPIIPGTVALRIVQRRYL